MPFELAQGDLNGFLPAEPGLLAHCRRVAALALEIAAGLSISQHSAVILEQAALLHHASPIAMNSRALGRISTDILLAAGVRTKAPTEEFTELPGELLAALDAFHRFPLQVPDPEARTMGHIIALSNLLDEKIEFLPYEVNSLSHIWEAVRDLREFIQPRVFEAAHERLGVFTLRTRYEWNLPAQMSVAKDLLRLLMTDEPPEVSRLAELAGRDPVISGSLVQAANSARHGNRHQVRSIRHAITHLGWNESRQLVAALALQPLFGSSNLQGLWRHSVWMAQFLETLARQSGFMDPEEAVLLGLTHDIGRIAIQTLPGGIAGLFTRLTQRGCAPAYAEQMLFGMDHAEIGARILESWQFPGHFVDAVRFHHRPADSSLARPPSSPAMAAALYVAEFWAETDEDLPCSRHLDAALTQTMLSFEDLAKIARGQGTLSLLLNAA
jgi:putative nucleotidyltransferase with HDIG domain